MHFDLTIRLGDVLIALGFVGGAFVFYGRYKVLESKVNNLWDWWLDEFPHSNSKPKHSSAHD